MNDAPLSVAFARRVLPGVGWEISEPLGSMGTTRVARRAGRSLVVKLIDVPDIVARLAEVGVAPPIVEVGEGYLLQEHVDGPNPDVRWFATHLEAWTGLLRRYLYDSPLAELVDGTPGRERLTVASAARLLGDEPGAGWPEACVRSFDRWRSQASSVASFPIVPIHTDAHMVNYVLGSGRPYLLDWDQIDLSDVVRDVGVQAWGFLGHRRWPDFLRRVHLEPSAEMVDAIYWWSAFKMLRTALWVEDGTFHAMLFERAVSRLDWITS
jgi:Phosphotransferase enzyme family